MSKLRVGSKENSQLNGEWRAHAGSTWLKRFTAKRRRKAGKKDIEKRLKE